MAGASALGALLAGLEEALAELLFVLRRRIELREPRQLVEPAQAEELLEQRGGAVEHGAELRPAGFLDDPAFEQRRDRRVGSHAADPRDLRPRDRREVRDDGQALRLRLRERRGAGTREQAPRGALGDGIGGQREATRDLA